LRIYAIYDNPSRLERRYSFELDVCQDFGIGSLDWHRSGAIFACNKPPSVIFKWDPERDTQITARLAKEDLSYFADPGIWCNPNGKHVFFGQ
jgi:hypothetical protein